MRSAFEVVLTCCGQDITLWAKSCCLRLATEEHAVRPALGGLAERQGEMKMVEVVFCKALGLAASIGKSMCQRRTA